MGFILTILFWLFALLLGLALVIVAGSIIYARWNYGSLEKLGIPVVKPHWLFGSNFNTLSSYGHTEDIERSRKYGHVYGVYEGRIPCVAVSDPKILRRIWSVDFEHFRNHQTMEIDHPVFAELLDFLKDEKWKTVRSVLTPQFTTGKIKQMLDTISEVSEDYVRAITEDLKGQDRKKMDIRAYLPPLILEIIGKCFCGINIQNARDPNNKFIETLRAAMGGDFRDFLAFSWKAYLAGAFPILQKLTPSSPNEPLDYFVKTMRGIIKSREESQTEKQDMVNTLLKMCQKGKTDKEYKKLGITDNTALAQAFEFFLASYDTTRTTLSLFTYHMAANPNIQEKLRKEIDSALKKSGGKINHETVAELPYLTSCISESLRLNPGFFRPDRVCNQDWEFEGLKIKKDMHVLIPLYALHYNPENYENPEKFHPERFMPGNKEKLDQYAFGSFGHGPRACVGQRFAFEMLKTIICHYMQKFTIEKRHDTEFTIIKSPIMLQYKPIYVDFVKRK